jgi:hypothetical protein
VAASCDFFSIVLLIRETAMNIFGFCIGFAGVLAGTKRSFLFLNDLPNLQRSSNSQFIYWMTAFCGFMPTPRGPLNEKTIWRRSVVFLVATAVCTVLAIWAVAKAPVGQALGVSGLYLAAAVCVPLALWFGVWGCLAGYLSCLFMGFYVGLPLPYLLVWALADFFEGFVPLLIYRSLKVEPAVKLKRPKVTGGLCAIMILDVAVSAVALVSNLTEIFIATFAVSILALAAQAVFEDRKTWLTWLFVGVFTASFVSGVFGVGAMMAFGVIPMGIFSSVFLGWIFGDIIVLATVGTVLTIALTPYIVKTRAYVHWFFS